MNGKVCGQEQHQPTADAYAQKPKGGMMRPKVAEIRAVTALLDKEWEDVTTLSEEVIRVVYEGLRQRDTWVVLARDASLGWFTFGPYESKHQATKAIGKQIVSPGPEPMQAMVTKLIGERND